MRTQFQGLTPERSRTVLLVLDMISDFSFPGGPEVQRAARRIAPRIAKLKRRAKRAGIACIYANDNPGRWRSDSAELIRQCLEPRAAGREVVRLLRPEERDYFILKPRHSAFYASPLEVLLIHLGARRLILTGVSSHQCVLFTANDAHIRNFEIIVPRDCIAGPTRRDTQFALRYFASVLRARVTSSALLRLKR